ncbi:MAG: hypothetical protein ACRD5H_17870 [Nitrososphaerales archaeon]
MGVSVTEIGAAVANLATAVRDFAENGIAPNLPSADTSASADEAALSIAQQALQKALPTAAYNLEVAGIAVNAIALDIAKAQAAEAEAKGDTAGYWAAIFGQIAAISRYPITSCLGRAETDTGRGKNDCE